MSPKDKPLAWLHGVVKTRPFSAAARLEAGYLLRMLQQGEKLYVFQKKTAATPKKVIDLCKSRLRMYDDER